MKLNKEFFTFCAVLVTVSTAVKILCAPNINLSGFSAIIAVALFAGGTVTTFLRELSLGEVRTSSHSVRGGATHALRH